MECQWSCPALILNVLVILKIGLRWFGGNERNIFPEIWESEGFAEYMVIPLASGFPAMEPSILPSLPAR